MNNEAAEQLQEEVIQQVENASSPEEVLDTRTPQEIEQEELKKLETATLDSLGKMKPEDLATHFFEMFFPMFQDKVRGLYANAANQVLEALVQWPLKEEKPKFKSKVQEDAFGLGTRLLDAKFIIMQSAQMDEKIRVDKLTELVDTNNTELQETLNNVETSFTQGEETNG